MGSLTQNNLQNLHYNWRDAECSEYLSLHEFEEHTSVLEPQRKKPFWSCAQEKEIWLDKTKFEPGMQGAYVCMIYQRKSGVVALSGF